MTRIKTDWLAVGVRLIPVLLFDGPPKKPYAFPLASILYGSKNDPEPGISHLILTSPCEIGPVFNEIVNSGRILISQLPVLVILSVSYAQVAIAVSVLGINPFNSCVIVLTHGIHVLSSQVAKGSKFAALESARYHLFFQRLFLSSS